MNLSELIEAVRIRTGDMSAPYLWSDDEITLNLNQADSEAAERALLIQDSTTAEVCTLTLDAGSASYPLHESILKIERAKLASTGDLLSVVSREALDKLWSGWETATGTPKYLFEDGEGNAVVVPEPTAADTIAITVKRLPLTVMASDADTPEIPVRHHSRMLYWALHLAYLKHDADAFDQQAADRYEAMFARSFGYRHDANVQRKHRDKRPNTIKSGW